MNEKNEQMILLPWIMPQQQSTQTIILQQPAKTHMELNASTDKTAISSFALSVVVALILGGLATWLAYWYGKKSFDLTKQSFDAVIAQIKSAEKIMLESNHALIRSQERVKQMELLNEKNNAIRLLGAEFILSCENLIYEAKSLQLNLGEKLPDDYVLELTLKRDSMENIGTRLELYLGNSHLRANVLLFKSELIRIITPSLRSEIITDIDLDYWKEEIRQFKHELFEYFENEFGRIMQGE
ncbi:hypothetical protein [Acinetobacter sp. WCHAc060033]|uniref:hypothetical protein n=1 Tax=Acinetobacter sp. WCHAc060033 TaxID=2518624 RepID=UPI001D194397|nr:hypothetical protein [Acinetobacter sp. WCHAc060033]